MPTNMLLVHASARTSIHAIYHEINLVYHKRKKYVYAFVEGQEDLLFYTGIIENMLPRTWSVNIKVVGTKRDVIRLHGLFDWNRFQKSRIAFFVDRDLSAFFEDEQITAEENIFITDHYSIENYIVCRNTCRRALRELLKLHVLPDDDIDKILALFERQIKKFQNIISDIMIYAIYWRKENKKIALNNIQMKEIGRVTNGNYLPSLPSAAHNSIEEYIQAKWRVPSADINKFSRIKIDFNRANGPRKYVRGKFMYWFFIEFLKSARSDINHIIATQIIPPKMNITLSQNGSINFLAPLARTPTSLKKFISKTLLAYTRDN